jgi:1-aminocyclopropane-1-carboxylate deaminase/D-cysteine desulfhydrase-like pyridoxal-dependent ACC family enzyme
VFKGGDYLRGEIEALSCNDSGPGIDNWSLWTDHHHGGYAKTSRELLSFIKEIGNACGIPLDHVYTGKLLYAIFGEAERGTFQRGTTLLAIHTGGLQGSISL